MVQLNNVKKWGLYPSSTKGKQQNLKLNAHSHFSYLKPNKIKNDNTITGHGTIRLIFYLTTHQESIIKTFPRNFKD